MSAIYETNYEISGNCNIGCGYIDCSITCARPSHNISQWNEDNYNRFYESLSARCSSEKERYDTRTKEHFYRDKISDSINSVDKSFQERLRDIDFWKNELDKEIGINIKETVDLFGQRDRLRFALLSLDLPTQINLDNSKSKTLKDFPEGFDDQVEGLLMKECCLINSCKKLLSKTLQETEDQIKTNQQRREELEADLSNKTIARNLDDMSQRFTTDSSAIIYYPCAINVSSTQSSPQEWAAFTLDNINRNTATVEKSGELRRIINSVLTDTSRDMREMSDRVEMSVGLRINQVESALHNLNDNLSLTNREIIRIESAIRQCDCEIKAKDAPLKLAETRLFTHNQRPGVELCRDEPQNKLIRNRELIHKAMSTLKNKRTELDDALSAANKIKIQTEDDIQMKEQSLFIDRNKFLQVRRRYPNTITLLGYPN